MNEAITMSEKTKLVINKAFFGKDNCLKLTLNSNQECYMHWGKKNAEGKYDWFKIKFNDLELGQIYDVLDGKRPSVAFFHSFGDKKRQIWINKNDKGDGFFFKIAEMNKSIMSVEATVMKLLIAQIIVRMNLEKP